MPDKQLFQIGDRAVFEGHDGPLRADQAKCRPYFGTVVTIAHGPHRISVGTMYAVDTYDGHRMQSDEKYLRPVNGDG